MIYLDHAANSPLSEAAAQAMEPWVKPGASGNPSTLHSNGRAARAALEDARDQVSDALGVPPLAVVFTSGATEANNIALFGACAPERNADRTVERATIASMTIEHPSVVNPVDLLTNPVSPVHLATWLPIAVQTIHDPQPGLANLDSLNEQLAAKPTLATLAAVNSEIGVVQPVEHLVEHADETTWTHIDITQALGKLALGDMCARATSTALSAHKVGGPVGVGVLTLRRDKNPVPVMAGGGQERGVRSGTIPVALIAGAGAAIAEAVEQQALVASRITQLQAQFEQAICTLPGVSIPTSSSPRSGFVSSVVMQAIDVDAMVMELDREGICVSTGSACQSGSLERSKTLLALGVPMEQFAIRVSMYKQTSEADIKEAIAIISRVHEKLYRG